eukprot:11647253-Prorocentrum_lima.AAC.1
MQERTWLVETSASQPKFANNCRRVLGIGSMFASFVRPCLLLERRLLGSLRADCAVEISLF